VELVSLTRSGGRALKVQSPVAQLLPLHEPEKEFKIVLPELVYGSGIMCRDAKWITRAGFPHLYGSGKSELP
jgi:hypothetical protein